MIANSSKVLRGWQLLMMASGVLLAASNCGGGSASSRTETGGSTLRGGATGGMGGGAGKATSPTTTTALGGSTGAAGLTTAAGGTATGGTVVLGGKIATGGTTGPDVPIVDAGAPDTAAPLADANLPDAASPDSRPADAALPPDAGIDKPTADAPADAVANPEVASGEVGTGACGATSWNKSFRLTGILGAAVDPLGNLFFSTKLFDSMDLGTGMLTSAGSADIAIAKLDPTGKAVWSKTYGDPADQIPGGIGVTKSGIVAMTGTFAGTLTLKDTITNTGTDPIDFLGALDPDGNGLWAKAIDTKGGGLVALATHSSQDTFVVCGYASDAATDLVPGATAGGDGKLDILLAKLNATTGAIVWSRQIPAAGDQLCAGVAMDSAGDVYAAGQYNGSLDLGKGPLSLVPGKNAQALWAGKFDGATGAAKASNGWGNDMRQSLMTMALDSAGNMVLGGGLRGTIPLGTLTLSGSAASARLDAGSTVVKNLDAFAIKLDSNLTPLWAHAWGDTYDQEIDSASFTPSGDVLVAGSLYGTIDMGGARTLVAATGADSYGAQPNDAFWMKLDGGTGVSVCGRNYGDAYDQYASMIVASPLATNPTAAFIGSFVGSIDFGLGRIVAPGINSSMPETDSFIVQIAP